MAWSPRLLLILVFVAGVALQITKAPEETTTTKAPEETTTTKAPEGTTTTKAPEETTTTKAPEETTTTKAPEETTTTKAPEETTTTKAPEETTTTKAPEETTTTKAPEETTTTNTTEETTTTNTTEPTTATTTKFPDACASQPCGRGSTCEERVNQTYACLCLTGDYYNYTHNLCVAAKVFPGDLTYTKVNYESEMADKKSSQFKTTAEAIVEALSKIGFPKGYLKSIVTKLSPLVSAKTKATTGILASVDIIFDETSNIKEEEVKKAITDKGETLGLKDFKATSLCEPEPCDTKTTTCENGTDGTFTCKCRKEYVPTDFSDRSCAACSNGYKAVDGICEPCDFGFSGFNCGDRWQLDLVIVGSVLGALLLIALILLPVVAVVSKKKSNKKPKNMDYEKSYSNPATAKPPQALNGFAGSRPTSVQAIAANGMPRIPRATTADSWDRNTNLEMMPSNSRQNLVPVGQNSRRYDDQEDMGRSAYNHPTRPQNNPYAVSRPQANPYASKQGQSNPYYSHDDERSYR